MTTFLGKSCSLSIVNVYQFLRVLISLLVLRVGFHCIDS